MKVTIRTKNGAVLSPFERKAIRHAAQFYAQTLMSNRITENLDVKINVINGYFKNHKIVVITTYDSSHILAAASLDIGYHFDFKIGDEAHHLTIRDLKFNVSQKAYIQFHEILSGKTLFMTATTKIYDYKIYNNPVKEDDNPEDDNYLIYSMNDETRFGKVIDTKSVKWAIENGKITDYNVVVLYNTITEILSIIKLFNIDINDKDLELFVSAYMTLKCLSKYNDLTHLLIYTNSTKNSDLVIKFINQLLENKTLISGIDARWQ